MSLRRRYLEPPQLHWVAPYCDGCYVETEPMDDGQFMCPECGTWWDANGDPESFQDWEDNAPETIPDLYSRFDQKIPRDAIVTIETETYTGSPLITTWIMIDGEEYYLSLVNPRELEEVKRTADLLQERIKQHYQLQDRKRRENAI